MAYGSVNVPGKLTAEQVGARPDTWMPTAADVGAVPAQIKFDGIAPIGGSSVSDVRHFYVCSTNGSTAEKVVTVSKGFSLVLGARVEVKFTYANYAANPTLNVNNTGARGITAYGTTAPDDYIFRWPDGAVFEFVYDGTNWIMVNGGMIKNLYDSLHSRSVRIGVDATVGLPSGSSVAIGNSAVVDGDLEVAIGAYSRASMTCSVALGRNAQATRDFSVAIGPNAAIAENRAIQLGDSFVSALKCKVSLTVTSDERDKADITLVDNGATEFLERVRAIRYVWNGRASYIDEETMTDEDRDNIANYGMCAYNKEAHEKGTKKGHRIRVGVSAQQVQEALQAVYGDSSYANIVNDNFFDYDPDNIPDGVENQLSVNYDGFIPFLIKAVQELSERIRKLEGNGHA